MPGDVLNVTIKPPFRDVLGRFAKADKALLDARREQMRELGRSWVAIARSEAPQGKTGKFKKSINYKTFESGSTVTLNTYAMMPLHAFITKGTKPHVIRARRAKVLYFYWEKGPNGPDYYAFKFVNHPGTSANPYHERATQRWLPQARQALLAMARSYTAALK
jgi:hypothetical protein